MIAFLPSRSEIYRKASSELQKLGRASITTKQLEDAIRVELESEYATPLRRTLEEAFSDRGFDWDSTRFGRASWVAITEGPDSIDFDGTIDSILTSSSRLRDAGPFRVSIPDQGDLAKDLADSLDGASFEHGRIATLEIDCSPPDPTCSVYLEVDDELTGPPLDIVEAYPARLEVELETTPWDLLARRIGSSPDELLTLTNTRIVSAEILDRDRLEAVALLRERESESQQVLSAFGTSFRGHVAIVVAPLLLVSSASFLLASLLSLQHLRPTGRDVAMGFVAPIFPGHSGELIRLSLLIVFPLAVDAGLAWAAVADFSPFQVACIVTCLVVHLVACAYCGRHAKMIASTS